MVRLLLFLLIPLVLSSCQVPESDDTVAEEIRQSLSVEDASAINEIASSGFQSGSRAVSDDVEEYLSYTADGGFSPIVFRSGNSFVIMGSSDGSVTIHQTGGNTFLCVFDRLVRVKSIPVFIPGGLSLDIVDVDRDDNAAFIDLERGEAYLVNEPFSADSGDDFLVFYDEPADGAIAYSDNRVYLLDKDGVLRTFLKDSPSNMTAVNHERAPIEGRAEVYTDDYIVFIKSSEDFKEDEPKEQYLMVYDATGKNVEKKTVFEPGSPLDNMIFRVGGNLFARELEMSDGNYGFRIYKLVIDEDMSVSVSGEGEYALIEEKPGEEHNEEHDYNKNSGVSVFNGDTTTLIRAENRYVEPLLSVVDVDEEGSISNIRTMRLTDGSEFPSLSTAEITDEAVYWGNEGEKVIYMADFNAKEITTITIEHHLLDGSLFVSGNGDIIYTAQTAGNAIGTFSWNHENKESILLSNDQMDVRQMYSVSRL